MLYVSRVLFVLSVLPSILMTSSGIVDLGTFHSRLVCTTHAPRAFQSVYSDDVTNLVRLFSFPFHLIIEIKRQTFKGAKETSFLGISIYSLSTNVISRRF